MPTRLNQPSAKTRSAEPRAKSSESTLRDPTQADPLHTDAERRIRADILDDIYAAALLPGFDYLEANRLVHSIMDAADADIEFSKTQKVSESMSKTTIGKVIEAPHMTRRSETKPVQASAPEPALKFASETVSKGVFSARAPTPATPPPVAPAHEQALLKEMVAAPRRVAPPIPETIAPTPRSALRTPTIMPTPVVSPAPISLASAPTSVLKSLPGGGQLVPFRQAKAPAFHESIQIKVSEGVRFFGPRDLLAEQQKTPAVTKQDLLRSAGKGQLVPYRPLQKMPGKGQLVPYRTLQRAPGKGQVVPYRSLKSASTTGNAVRQPSLQRSTGKGQLVPYRSLTERVGGGQVVPYRTLANAPGKGQLVPYRSLQNTPGKGQLVPYRSLQNTPGKGQLVPYRSLQNTPGKGQLVPYRKQSNTPELRSVAVVSAELAPHIVRLITSQPTALAQHPRMTHAIVRATVASELRQMPIRGQRALLAPPMEEAHHTSGETEQHDAPAVRRRAHAPVRSEEDTWGRYLLRNVNWTLVGGVVGGTVAAASALLSSTRHPAPRTMSGVGLGASLGTLASWAWRK